MLVFQATTFGFPYSQQSNAPWESLQDPCQALERCSTSSIHHERLRRTWWQTTTTLQRSTRLAAHHATSSRCIHTLRSMTGATRTMTTSHRWATTQTLRRLGGRACRSCRRKASKRFGPCVPSNKELGARLEVYGWRVRQISRTRIQYTRDARVETVAPLKLVSSRGQVELEELFPLMSSLNAAY